MGLAAGVTGALRLPPASIARTDVSHFMVVRRGDFTLTQEKLSRRVYRSQTKPGGGWRGPRGEKWNWCVYISPAASQRIGRGCDQFAAATRSSFSLTLIPLTHTQFHTRIPSHTDTDPTGKRAHSYSTYKHTLIHHSCTHMVTCPHTLTPTPTTLVTHNPSPITLSPSVTFPGSPCSPAILL